jgi:hypothetical protein
VPDLAGPKVYGMAELSRGYLQATGKRWLMMPVRMPGKAGRACRAGQNLTLDRASVGTRTWEDFLAERLPKTGENRATSRPTAEPRRTRMTCRPRTGRTLVIRHTPCHVQRAALVLL